MGEGTILGIISSGGPSTFRNMPGEVYSALVQHEDQEEAPGRFSGGLREAAARMTGTTWQWKEDGYIYLRTYATIRL